MDSPKLNITILWLKHILGLRHGAEFISIFIFNVKVFAGANLSVSTNSVTKGGTFTVSVNMYGAAAWNIHVTASGPVSGCSINQADATADAYACTDG